MAKSAQPVLGSILLATVLAKKEPKLAPASTSCRTLDTALHGGFRYGEITSLAGASGMGKTLVRPFSHNLKAQISLHAVASHLVAYASGEAAIIDTTGSFSPLRLRDIIVHRLRQTGLVRYQQSGYVYEKVSTELEIESLESLRAKATEMLDRVKVMRVFDFAGVIEAIGEAGDLCKRDGRSSEEVDAERVREMEEVANSEDEGDEVTISDEPEDPRAQDKRISSGRGLGMMIVDNIANLVSTAMSKNQTEGLISLLMTLIPVPRANHSYSALTLLTHSLRILSHLTTSNSLCTLLINGVVLNTSSIKSSFHGRTYHPSDNVSIYVSTSGKPALGRTYTYLIDTSVFLSTVPKTQDDAEVAFEDGTGRFVSVGVLEVLKDRYGEREGEWGAFEIVEGVELRGVG
ncbi:hypothetical protein MMC18_000542 [Xylographa bjoerkii]|nr:hypothetical protein [Xylographa bjoerkii]